MLVGTALLAAAASRVLPGGAHTLHAGPEAASVPCSCQSVRFNSTKCLWVGQRGRLAQRSHLTVLLRGEVFRNGSSGSVASAGSATAHSGTSLDPQTVDEQAQALHSINTYVLAPLARAGWDVTVALNAVTHDGDAGEALLRSQVSLHLANSSHARLGQMSVRRSSDETQGVDLVRVLGWLRNGCTACAAGALLLLRLDLIFLGALRVPRPNDFAAATTLLYPWYDSYDQTELGRRIVNDVFVFVPPRSRGAYESMLQQMPPGYDLSWALDKLPPSHDAPSACVLYTGTMDPNSAKAYNPVYRMCSRSRCPDPKVATSAALDECPPRDADDEANAHCPGGVGHGPVPCGELKGRAVRSV